MALIAMPAKFGFKNVSKFGLVRATNTVRSRYTGHRQTIVYPYAVWVLQAKLIEYPEGVEARAIRAFLASLDGEANTFNFPVPGWTPITQNMLTPTVLFDVYGTPAAGATQLVVRVSGAGVTYNNVEPLLPVGSYFTVNGELKIVTEDLGPAGGGDISTVKFKPALRAAVAFASVITARNPYCVMASIDEDVATWGVGPPVKHEFELNAMEAF